MYQLAVQLHSTTPNGQLSPGGQISMVLAPQSELQRDCFVEKDSGGFCVPPRKNAGNTLPTKMFI